MKLRNVIRQAVFLLPLLAVPLVCQAMASEGLRDPQAPFWDQVHDLVVRCAVQPYTVQNGRKIYGPLESVCPEVQVKGSHARFQLNNQWFLATIADSEDSDGGDLNDVSVVDRKGANVADRHEVLAFGDVLLALAGGQVQSPERYVDELQTEGR